MLAEYQAQNNVPQEVRDQILESVKESSVGEVASVHRSKSEDRMAKTIFAMNMI